MKRRKNIFGCILVLGGIFVFILILVCYLLVMINSTDKTYDNAAEIPYNKVGLLLATSPITSGGSHNFYFEYRIKAAEELYKAGKINYIIASGGNYSQFQKNGCNEPEAILDSLLVKGIPKERIILDYDGTTTLNSIYKALKKNNNSFEYHDKEV